MRYLVPGRREIDHHRRSADAIDARWHTGYQYQLPARPVCDLAYLTPDHSQWEPPRTRALLILRPLSHQLIDIRPTIFRLLLQRRAGTVLDPYLVGESSPCTQQMLSRLDAIGRGHRQAKEVLVGIEFARTVRILRRRDRDGTAHDESTEDQYKHPVSALTRHSTSRGPLSISGPWRGRPRSPPSLGADQGPTSSPADPLSTAST